MRYLIPLIFIAIIVYAAIKRVQVFSAFSRGVKGALSFTLDLIPLLVCVFIMCEVFERSHLSDAICSFLAPAFNALGVPPGLAKLVLIKPFSGSGSLSFLSNIIAEYGADSYVARCACVLYGSSETVFYISAIYFAKSKQKKRALPIILILAATFITTVIACLLCRVM